MNLFLHETIYRGQESMQRLGQKRLVVCGAGALGSHFLDNLVRHGLRTARVIDRDRVEEHNVGTQVYDRDDIGAFKAEVMQARCFRVTGVEIEAVARELTGHNIQKFLDPADLVVDTFDNSVSRRLVTDHCRSRGLPCLHLGVNADYGEVLWNECYRVPQDQVAVDVCDYPLARNLLLFVVAIGSEVALRFLLHGQKENYSFTLRDLRINPE